MLDYNNRADEALEQLREFAGNPCYQAMVAWMTAVFEREKERMALAVEPDLMSMHWANCRGMLELLSDINVEPD